MNLEKKRMKRIRKGILVFLAAILFTRYPVLDIFASAISEKDYVEVKELDLGEYEEEMKVGDKQLLTVTVLPQNAFVFLQKSVPCKSDGRWVCHGAEWEKYQELP